MSEPGPDCITFWRSEGPDGAEFLRARYRSLRFAPHAHDRYLLALLTGGALEISDPRRCAVAGAGQVVLYDADRLHWGRAAAEEGWSILSIYLPASVLDRAASELGDRPAGTIGFPRMVADGAALARSVAQLWSAAARGSDALARESLLLDLVVAALVRHGGGSMATPVLGRESRAARLARDCIDGNFAEPLGLDRLAAVAGVGRFRVIRAFKQAYGVPPYAYLTNVRVREALVRLRAGMDVAETALACGFADQSHHSRMVKRSTGLTPARFRGRKTG
jgi:AraC-like DNA-binding protein